MVAALKTAVQTRSFPQPGHEQQYPNMIQETDKANKFYTNTDSSSKSDNTDKQKVENKLYNTIDYFLPGPSHDNDKRVSAKITQQLQRDF